MYARQLGGSEPARWVQLPYGEAGTWATVDAMRQVARQAAATPLLQDTARAIGAGNPLQLREWLQSHFRFRYDPPEYEAIWTPAAQLQQIMRQGYALGDCDDAAVLGASLALAAGLSARFVLLGFEGPRGMYAHVFTETGGVELDVTKQSQRVAPATRRTTVEV